MVSYERVLVPTDGSDDTAVEHAFSIAAPGAVVHALYVVDKKLLYAAGDGGEQLGADLRSEGENAVEAVAAAAEDAGFETRTEIREGVPPREIVAYVESADIDAVAMGTHSRSGTERVVNMGSTTERVIEKAGVPVLAVPVP